MLVAVAGGNLQGVEAAYLAHKAGWDVLVLDRKPVAPAAGLGNSFTRIDVTSKKDLTQALDGVDLVIPTLENPAALDCLHRVTRNMEIPFAFDPTAYGISCSKITSDQLFKSADISTPAGWPECNFPVIAKPGIGSGSRGLKIYKERADLPDAIIADNREWLIQEFVTGPSYSLEIVGLPGQYVTPQVTELEMDSRYDCKRVTAPSNLADSLIDEFERLSLTLANTLNLKGIMDVEVILHKNELKVIEIDARLPSQTPTAVYWSTGINMVQLLGELFIDRWPYTDPVPDRESGVIYEHLRVTSDRLEIAGERIMTIEDPLHIEPGFFGADEAITNYAGGRQEWVATLIVTEENMMAAREKRNSIIDEIRKSLNLDNYQDSTPAGFGSGENL